MTKQEFTLRQLKRNKRIYTGCYYGYLVILAVALFFLGRGMGDEGGCSQHPWPPGYCDACSTGFVLKTH